MCGYVDDTLTVAGPHFLYATSSVATADLSAVAPASPGPLPSGWSSQDVGAVGLSGSATYDPSTGGYAVTGGGSDIYGANDTFRYAYTSITGDGQVVARVDSIQNTDAWAKAGVMVRESLAANSKNVMTALTVGQGVNVTGRAVSGGGSTNYGYVRGVVAPGWVRLVRSGNAFSGYRSTDGSNWSLVASANVSMQQTVYVGLAVTSHDNTEVGTSMFGNVTVTAPSGMVAPSQLAATAQAGPSVRLNWVDNSTFEASFLVQRTANGGTTWSDLATVGANVTQFDDATVASGSTYGYRVQAVNALATSPFSTAANVTVGSVATWTGGDIGAVGATGSDSVANGTYTVRGSGADVYYSADAFRFVRQQVTGDATIVARVTSVQNVDPWTKVGVMIRESLAANAKNVFHAVTPASGAFVSQRVATNGTTTRGTNPATATPVWLKLVRTGNTFTAQRSNDGVQWTTVGTVTVSMTASVYVGLAVTSHKAGVLATATFDNVSRSAPSTPAPLAWSSAASAPLPKYEHAGLAVGGKLYSFGGFYNTRVQTTAQVDAYDPVANSWKTLGNMPEQITHAGQATDGRYIFLLGGFVGNHPGPMTKHAWRYDTQNNAWSALPDLPELVGGGAAAIVGRTLYFFGGTYRTDNVYTADSTKTWALNLDATKPTWVAKAALLEGRNHLAGVTLNGLVYAIGGQQLGSEMTGNRATVNVYNPATNSWSTVAPLPIATGHIVASTFVMNGRIRVIGGITQNSVKQDTVFEYNPATNTWANLTPFPGGGRQSPIADVINGVMYVSGGFINGTVYSSTYRGA